jgi:hypothetical protein
MRSLGVVVAVAVAVGVVVVVGVVAVVAVADGVGVVVADAVGVGVGVVVAAGVAVVVVAAGSGGVRMTAPHLLKRRSRSWGARSPWSWSTWGGQHYAMRSSASPHLYAGSWSGGFQVSNSKTTRGKQ